VNIPALSAFLFLLVINIGSVKFLIREQRWNGKLSIRIAEVVCWSWLKIVFPKKTFQIMFAIVLNIIFRKSIGFNLFSEPLTFPRRGSSSKISILPSASYYFFTLLHDASVW